jgi:hypothetical protein
VAEWAGPLVVAGLVCSSFQAGMLFSVVVSAEWSEIVVDGEPTVFPGLMVVDVALAGGRAESSRSF